MDSSPGWFAPGSAELRDRSTGLKTTTVSRIRPLGASDTFLAVVLAAVQPPGKPPAGPAALLTSQGTLRLGGFAASWQASWRLGSPPDQPQAARPLHPFKQASRPHCSPSDRSPGRALLALVLATLQPLVLPDNHLSHSVKHRFLFLL